LEREIMPGMKEVVAAKTQPMDESVMSWPMMNAGSVERTAKHDPV
jgi:hypothetical protein